MEVAALTRPMKGETDNGDGYLIAALDSGMNLEHFVVSDPAALHAEVQRVDLRSCDKALVAVVDGVGHGSEAAEATARIVDCIRENTRLGLLPLVRECHKRAAHSRGAALCSMLIDLNESSFHFVGVGNVKFQIATVPSEGEPLRISFWPKYSANQMEVHRLVSNNGTVGYTLPKKLLSFTREYSDGDLIVITTDGVREDATIGDLSESTPFLSATSIVTSLFSKFGTDTDDATAVVIK